MEEILDNPSSSNKQGEEGHTSLQELIDNGFKLDFGAAFTDAFDHWKENWALITAYSLIMVLLIFISALTVVGVFIVALPLTVGFHYAAMKHYKGDPVKFGDYFDGFKKTGDLFVLMFIQLLIIAAPIIVLVLVTMPVGMMAEDFSEEAMLAYTGVNVILQFVIMVFAYAMSILFYFAPSLVTMSDLSPVQALKVSFKLAKKQFWWILLCIIASSAIAQLGIMACGIGILATLGFTEIMRAAVHKQILGLSSRREEASELH